MQSERGRSGIRRREFLGYVLAAPTLVVAAKLGKDALTPKAAGAAVPSLPEPSDLLADPPSDAPSDSPTIE